MFNVYIHIIFNIFIIYLMCIYIHIHEEKTNNILSIKIDLPSK